MEKMDHTPLQQEILQTVSLLLVITVRCCSSPTRCGLETIHDVQRVTEPGDLMLGGIIQLSAFVKYDNSDLVQRGWTIHRSSQPTAHYLRHLLAFMFAVEEINRRPDLLPNTTLGYTIYDVCMLEDLAVQSALSILSGVEEPVPNYSCDQKSKVVAFIGHLDSSPSCSIAGVSGIYKYPQISYGAMDSIFSDKSLYPYFYRTVPDERSQHRAIVLLLKHFGWSWVGIVVASEDSSQRSSMELHKEIIQSGLCVAFMQTIKKRRKRELEFSKNVYIMLKTSCSVVLFFGNSRSVFDLEQLLYRKFNFRKVIIFPAIRFSYNPNSLIALNRSLMMSPPRRDIPGLREYLLSAGPHKYPHVQVLSTIWKNYFYCCVGNASKNYRPCTEKDLLSQVDASDYDVNNFANTFSIYSAVYAVAHALHDLFSYKEHGQLQSFRRSHQPWKVWDKSNSS
ncbi:vomeronasal type-2 receptor 1-like [Hyperolius riggenbachi]|uniref:vomeronasal type-2 receptor 1-like n=1 Tax=Hyperolius riggenbachi TaxID=752182 RepID=UPI0035A2F910